MMMLVLMDLLLLTKFLLLLLLLWGNRVLLQQLKERSTILSVEQVQVKVEAKLNNQVILKLVLLVIKNTMRKMMKFSHNQELLLRLLKISGVLLVHWNLMRSLLIHLSRSISNSNLANLDIISLSLVKSEKMVEFKVLAKRSTILSMKVNSRTISITDTVVTFMLTAITILANG